MKRPSIPSARDIMARHVETLSVDMDIDAAVRQLLRHGHSGAPVLDERGKLVGVLSEHDGIRVLAEAITEKWPLGSVGEHMTRDVETVAPNEDLLALASHFVNGRHRRLLVVEDDTLVGLIGRRDLMRALEVLEARIFGPRRRTTYELMEERHRKLD